jgi:hypothetical protein
VQPRTGWRRAHTSLPDTGPILPSDASEWVVHDREPQFRTSARMCHWSQAGNLRASIMGLQPSTELVAEATDVDQNGDIRFLDRFNVVR